MKLIIGLLSIVLAGCATPVKPSNCETETRYLYFCDVNGGSITDCKLSTVEFCRGDVSQLLIKKDKK